MDLLYNTPIKENKPINEMPENKEWTIVVGTRLIVENKPPMRNVYINHTLVSQYRIGDAESERIAVVHIYLNGIGTQAEIANIWGLHRNTIGNYVSGYNKLGFKGLTDLYYQPEIKISRYKDLDRHKEDEVQISLFENETSNSTQQNTSDNEEIVASEEKSKMITDNVIPQEDVSLKTINTEYGGSMLFYPFITELYENVLKEASTVDEKVNCTTTKTFGC